MHYMEPTRSRRVAARTVGLFRPHKWLFLALVVVAAAGAALQLLPVLVIARIVNEITPEEIGGRKGPEPTRFGDWEKNGRCIDF